MQPLPLTRVSLCSTPLSGIPLLNPLLSAVFELAVVLILLKKAWLRWRYVSAFAPERLFSRRRTRGDPRAPSSRQRVLHEKRERLRDETERTFLPAENSSAGGGELEVVPENDELPPRLLESDALRERRAAPENDKLPSGGERGGDDPPSEQRLYHAGNAFACGAASSPGKHKLAFVPAGGRRRPLLAFSETRLYRQQSQAFLYLSSREQGCLGVEVACCVYLLLEGALVVSEILLGTELLPFRRLHLVVRAFIMLSTPT